MTKEEFIIDVVSKYYNISLITPYKKRKEALQMAAYMLRKHTNLKHVAISLILGSTMKSTNHVKSVTDLVAKREIDPELDSFMSDIEASISEYICSKYEPMSTLIPDCPCRNCKKQKYQHKYQHKPV